MDKHKRMARFLFGMAMIAGLASCNIAVGEYPHDPADEIMSALFGIAGAVFLVGGAIVRAVTEREV